MNNFYYLLGTQLQTDDPQRFPNRPNGAALFRRRLHPTRASFPFLHGNALAEAGHEVQIFLLGEGVSLMRDSTLNAITPVGWPPLKEVIPKVLANKIQIYACGACCKARGIVDTDLENKNAKFGNPQIFVGLTEWCDKIITE
jgi:predicted peroxiredoxin